MSFIGLPSLAMLLVLANIALCLTAESQKRGMITEFAITTSPAIPLGGVARSDTAGSPARTSARRD